MISTKNLKRIVKISEYSTWTVLIFITGFIITTELGINPLLPEINAQTDEENQAKLEKLASMITDLKNIERDFTNLQNVWMDRTVSVCYKAPKVINLFTKIATFDLVYDVTLLDSERYFTLAKLLGLAYMLDCTTFEYHESHDMLSMALQFQGMKSWYESKYEDEF